MEIHPDIFEFARALSKMGDRQSILILKLKKENFQLKEDIKELKKVKTDDIHPPS